MSKHITKMAKNGRFQTYFSGLFGSIYSPSSFSFLLEAFY